jgi:hypothetical protein
MGKNAEFLACSLPVNILTTALSAAQFSIAVLSTAAFGDYNPTGSRLQREKSGESDGTCPPSPVLPSYINLTSRSPNKIRDKTASVRIA